MDQFIGYDFAKEYGYTLTYFTADKSLVTYTNELCIALTIKKDFYDERKMEGTLKLNYKSISLQIGPFSIPNKNFHIFEKQMTEAYFKLNNQC